MRIRKRTRTRTRTKTRMKMRIMRTGIRESLSLMKRWEVQTTRMFTSCSSSHHSVYAITQDPSCALSALSSALVSLPVLPALLSCCAPTDPSMPSSVPLVPFSTPSHTFTLACLQGLDKLATLPKLTPPLLNTSKSKVSADPKKKKYRHQKAQVEPKPCVTNVARRIPVASAPVTGLVDGNDAGEPIQDRKSQLRAWQPPPSIEVVPSIKPFKKSKTLKNAVTKEGTVNKAPTKTKDKPMGKTCLSKKVKE